MTAVVAVPVAGPAARLRDHPAGRRRLPHRRASAAGPGPAVDGLELIEMRPARRGRLAAGRPARRRVPVDRPRARGGPRRPRAGAPRRRPLRSSWSPAATTTAARRRPTWPAGSSPPTCRGATTQLVRRRRASTSPSCTMGGALEGVCAAGHGRRHRRPARDRAQPGREPAAGAGRDGAVRGAVRPRRRPRPRRPGGAHRCRARRPAAPLRDAAPRPRAASATWPRCSPGWPPPTVLPLAGRDDLVAVHLVTEAGTFWTRLQDLRALGATGIVALPPDALVD